MDPLIPDHMVKLIASANEWDDGDIWFLGNGRKAEFDGRKSLFTISEKGRTIGTVPLKKILGTK